MATDSGYVVDFQRPVQVEVDGQRYSFEKGSTFTPPNQDPCWILSFLKEVQAQNFGAGLAGDAETSATMEELRARCPSGEAHQVVTPPPLASTPDPQTTGVDRRPPTDDPSAADLNAPAPDVIAGLKGRSADPPTQSFGQLYYDPKDPANVDKINDFLVSRGLGADEITKGLVAARQNEAPPAEPHPEHSVPKTEAKPRSNDPVLLFSGQFALDLVDVSFETRGLAIGFGRMYRSGAVSFGPLGYNWDHNYNAYLRSLTHDRVAIWTGELSEEVYQLVPTSPAGIGTRHFEPSPGVFSVLEHHIHAGEDERYELKDVIGRVRIFRRPDGWPLPDRLPLVTIADSRGYEQHLQYDSTARLARVADDDGRALRFDYDDASLLARVTDHIGRSWSYEYDDEAHLVAVTTPPSASFEHGVTNRYRYFRGASHPALRHAMVSVEDGLGQTVVENLYGTDPGTFDWNRVVRQKFAGFESSFAYSSLQYVPPGPESMNVPAVRVDVVDPGVLYVFTFNNRGDMLDSRHRLSADRSHRLYAETFRYDEHGNLEEYRDADGSGFRRLHDSSNRDARARGNVLREWQLPAALSSATPRLVYTAAYEPRYHRLKRLEHEAGAATVFVYDYEEHAVDRGDVIRIEYPVVTLPDGEMQAAHEHFEYDAGGLLTQYRSPSGRVETYSYVETGPTAGYLRGVRNDVAGGEVLQTFEYDQGGRISAFTDGAGRTTRYVRDVLGHLERIILPPVDGRSDDLRFKYRADGLLVQQFLPRGSYADGTITGDHIVDTIDYDPLGHPCRITRGANTATPHQWTIRSSAEGWPLQITDPIGRTTWLRYDERGLLLNEYITDPDAPALRLHERTLAYDRVGRQVRYTHSDGVVESCSYDEWGRLTDVSTPNQGDAPPTVTHYSYGPSDELTGVEIAGPTGESGVGPLAATAIEYDERERPIRVHEAGDTLTLWYDADDALVRCVNTRGLAEEFRYDDAGRLVERRDGLGNSTTLGYGGDGEVNVVVVREADATGRVFEPLTTRVEHDPLGRVRSVIDSAGNAWRFEWDARGHQIATTDPLGHRSESRYGLIGDRVAHRFVLTDGSFTEWKWLRDAAGRTLQIEDPDGRRTRFEYGAHDEPDAMVRPDGSQIRWRLDRAGRMLFVNADGGVSAEYRYGADGRLSHVSATGPPEVAPVGDLDLGYDGLGRLVRMRRGDLTLTRQYDDQDRLVSEAMAGRASTAHYDDEAGEVHLTYPDGRIDRFQHDLLDRLVAIRTIRPGTLVAVAAGADIARFSYSGTRLRSLSFANGSSTDLQFDAGGRPIEVRHRTGAQNVATARYLYDARGHVRVRQISPAPQGIEAFEYDELGRLSHAAYGLPLPDVPLAATQDTADPLIAAITASSASAARHERFAFDRIGARRRMNVDTAGSSLVRTTRVDDTLRVIDETDESGGSTTVARFDHDGDGRRTSDRRFRYEYDAAGRLRRVFRLGDAVPLLQLAWDPLDRLHEIIDETGRSRRFIHFGDLLVQEEAASGAVAVQYTAGPGGMSPILRVSGGGGVWLHEDLLGSVIAVTGDNGEVIEQIRFDAFGEHAYLSPDDLSLRPASAIELLPRFAGHWQFASGVPGLYDAGARAYDAPTGRFLTPDPGWSHDDSAGDPYAYVDSDPISFVDPDGAERVHEFLMGFGGAVAGGVAAVLNAGKETVFILRDIGRPPTTAIGLPPIPAWSQIGKAREAGYSWRQIGGALLDNLVSAPSKGWAALRRGDTFEFSYEMTSFALAVVRPGIGVIRGVANRTVSLAWHFGPKGQAITTRIRTWQAKRLVKKAVRMLGPQVKRPPGAAYERKLDGGKTDAKYSHVTEVVTFAERAFTPPILSRVPFPVARFVLKRFKDKLPRRIKEALEHEILPHLQELALPLPSPLRGNHALRTALHDVVHHVQFTSKHPYLYYRSLQIPSYAHKPIEFTLKKNSLWESPFDPFKAGGAWHFERFVPMGPLPKFALEWPVTVIGNLSSRPSPKERR